MSTVPLVRAPAPGACAADGCAGAGQPGVSVVQGTAVVHPDVAVVQPAAAAVQVSVVGGQDGAERPLLTAAEMRVWRTFLRAHATLVRRLEGELVTEHDLPLASYDVLVQLSESPTRSLRMTELAERVLLSRSGLTRLVDRLVRDGLVERQACPDDARGTLAVLTAAGLDRLRRAWPTHLRGVAEHVKRLTPDEVETLAHLLGKLVPAASRDDRTGGGLPPSYQGVR